MSALQIHGRSLCHLAASNALQVRKTVFLFIFTFNLIYLYFFLTCKTISLSLFVSFFKSNFNNNKRPFHFALQHYGYVSFCPVGNSFFTHKC